MKVILIVGLLCSVVFSQILYEEYFTDGNMQLDWHPWFTDSLGIGDSMAVINDTTTPGGDSWAGRISNEYMGMAGLTYAGLNTLTDYQIESWIYTVVNTGPNGPYNGIAMRMNETNRYYYRLVSDFDYDARIRLGLIASGGMPVVLRDWTSSEIPGGVPNESSWHKLKLMMIADSIWAYYDDIMLPGCPIINDSVTQGYFGIYTFNATDTASTKCDNIIVANATGVAEYDNATLTSFGVYPNPFRDKVSIVLSAEGKEKATLGTMPLAPYLKIYDAIGRLVKDFSCSTHYAQRPTLITWDGTDNSGLKLPTGIYFVRFSAGDYTENEEIILLR